MILTRRSPHSLLLVAALAWGAVTPACSATSAPGARPADVPGCSATADGSADATSLLRALASAKAGTCVRAGAATYRGTFIVPAGVTLLGVKDGTVLTSTDAAKPAVTLAGGAGTGLRDLRVQGAAGVGIALRQGPAALSGVRISGAKGAALAILCRGAECGADASVITLDDVHLEASTLGLWVSGARVRMSGGASSKHSSGGALSGGGGIVAQDGAQLELLGTAVEGNEGVGVLVDGAGGTRANLRDVRVADNGERGVWAQRLAATASAPALRIEGAATDIVRNAVVGVGAAESRGIIVVGGRIADTIAKKMPTDLGLLEDVGDGIGLYAGTGDVRIEGVTFERNARTAGLVDAGRAGIIVVGGKVEDAGGRLKFVVQKTADAVSLPEGYASTAGRDLGVSAPTLGLAKVLD